LKHIYRKDRIDRGNGSLEVKIMIRRARLDDIDELVELWKRFMAQQRGLGGELAVDMLPRMKEDAQDIVRSYISRSIRGRNGFVMVVEDRGKLRGYMLSRIQKNIPIFKNEYTGYVSDLYLDEGYRGKGLSSKMWVRTLQWFREKGVGEVGIRVLSYNHAAYEVYRRWGFRDYLKELRIDLD